MSEKEEHDCRDDEKTRSDIDKYGLTVIILKATDYLPSFAYSIGLWEKYQHPEIISFGLTTKTLHAIVNNAARIVKGGREIKTNTTYSEIFQGANAEFVKVDKRSIHDYFGTAIDFYNSYKFPALQLIWTDRNNKFPWEQDFEEEFTYRQPLLDRNANFKFREAKNTAAFTTRQWLEEKKPILHVVHDHEGDWQFLTGDQEEEDIKIVALDRLTLRDDSLNEVFNLGYGEEAIRDTVGGKWRRYKMEHEEELRSPIV